MSMLKHTLGGAFAALVLASAAAAAEPQVLPLWNGPAPGSESWTLPERITRTPTGEIASIGNVREPTMSVYLPDAAKANGAAVVILPGGGLRGLGWDTCVNIAEWLNSQGVAAIIVKYRVLQVPPPAPRPPGAPPPPRPPGGGLPVDLVIKNANANPAPNDKGLSEVLVMGVADAQSAMRIVRKNASAWKIDPKRVGFLGISAGGGVAVGAALAPAGEAYPDFLISFYGPSLQDVSVPAHAPPLLMGVAADHQPVTNGLVALHEVWKAAKKPSELHIYDGDVVEGSFRRRGGAIDSWGARILEWMALHNILKPAA